MQAKCKTKFSFTIDSGETRLFRPGNVIDDDGAATWAVANGFGTEIKDNGQGGSSSNSKAKAPAKNKVDKPDSNK